MAKSNRPLSIVRSTETAKNPKGWPVKTLVFATSYETPDGKVYALSDDSYAGKRFTPTLVHPQWRAIVNSPDFPEYVPV